MLENQSTQSHGERIILPVSVEAARAQMFDALSSSGMVDALMHLRDDSPSTGPKELSVNPDGNGTLVVGDDGTRVNTIISASLDPVTGSFVFSTAAQTYLEFGGMDAGSNDAKYKPPQKGVIKTIKDIVKKSPKEHICNSECERTTYNENCCHCLSKGSLIDTPNGAIKVEKLKSGDLIFTVTNKGVKKVSAISKIAKVIAGTNHKMLKVKLENGNEIVVSLEHPDINGTPLLKVLSSGYISNVQIIDVKLIKYQDKFTYDILPEGETGAYWVNGVLLGSTISSNFQHELCSHIRFA